MSKPTWHQSCHWLMVIPQLHPIGAVRKVDVLQPQCLANPVTNGARMPAENADSPWILLLNHMLQVNALDENARFDIHQL